MNIATKINVTALSTILGLSGISHGVFEVLQGNQPTPGVFICAIGEAQQMWIHGQERAITLIPNFLFSGVTAIIIGLAIIAWSHLYIQRKHGATVLLLLYILLLFLGGGIAQVLFFPWIWLAARNIHSPLNRWKKILAGRRSSLLRSLWPSALVIGCFLFLFSLVVATTGFIPGIGDADITLNIMLICLSIVLALFPLLFIGGYAKDVESQRTD